MAEKRVTLGTDQNCTIRVNDDPYVSNRHAQITQDIEGRYWIEDMGSTNGTWIVRPRLGRVRVYMRTLLLPGDEIWLGARTGIPWAGVTDADPR